MAPSTTSKSRVPVDKTGGIFVCYRRNEGGVVDGLVDELEKIFGTQRVLRDTAVDAGDLWSEKIDALMDRSSVFLLVIGKAWIVEMPRLLEPGDRVRYEIEHAAESNLPTIPVLLDGVLMPNEEQLPASIRWIAHRQAAKIRTGKDRDRDIDDLRAAIIRIAPQLDPRRRLMYRSAVAVVTVAGIGIATAVAKSGDSKPVEKITTEGEGRTMPSSSVPVPTHVPAPGVPLADGSRDGSEIDASVDARRGVRPDGDRIQRKDVKAEAEVATLAPVAACKVGDVTGRCDEVIGWWKTVPACGAKGEWLIKCANDGVHCTPQTEKNKVRSCP